MYVSRLQLDDFRCYEQADIQLVPGPNLFIGHNGQGKTNLVEAIAYLATLDSHRVATEAPLVRHGTPRAVVRATVVRDDRELTVDVEIAPGKTNRARLNKAPVRRARDILGALRTVVFAPEDLAIVRGDPTERRHYLDQLLIARTPRFAGIKADYERVLKQRNALLKTVSLARRAGSSGDLRTLDVWDGHLAQHGAQLLHGRLDLVAALAPYVAKAYDTVSNGRGAALLEYKSALDAPLPGVPDTEVLAAQLGAAIATARLREVERGLTLVGPHRDDLTLRLGDLPVRGYASHGESWSYALALRLASYDLLTAEGGEPVLILDDVFAELDTARRDRLARLVVGGSQVLVTAAVSADVPEVLAGARFDVHAGQVRRVC